MLSDWRTYTHELTGKERVNNIRLFFVLKSDK